MESLLPVHAVERGLRGPGHSRTGTVREPAPGRTAQATRHRWWSPRPSSSVPHVVSLLPFLTETAPFETWPLPPASGIPGPLHTRRPLFLECSSTLPCIYLASALNDCGGQLRLDSQIFFGHIVETVWASVLSSVKWGYNSASIIEPLRSSTLSFFGQASTERYCILGAPGCPGDTASHGGSAFAHEDLRRGTLVRPQELSSSSKD